MVKEKTSIFGRPKIVLCESNSSLPPFARTFGRGGGRERRKKGEMTESEDIRGWVRWWGREEDEGKELIWYRAVRSAFLDFYDSVDGKEECCARWGEEENRACGGKSGRGGWKGHYPEFPPKALLRLRFPLARQRRAFPSSLFVSEVFTTLVVPVLPLVYCTRIPTLVSPFSLSRRGTCRGKVFHPDSCLVRGFFSSLFSRPVVPLRSLGEAASLCVPMIRSASFFSGNGKQLLWNVFIRDAIHAEVSFFSLAFVDDYYLYKRFSRAYWIRAVLFFLVDMAILQIRC